MARSDMQRLPADRRGFTLIEVILVVILLGIVGAVFGPGLTTAMRAALVVDNRKEALQSVRLGLDRMAREIRQVRSATATDIQTWAAADFRFNDAYANNIEFTLSGSNLMRNADVLAGNVTALAFSYLKKDRTGAAAVTEVWTVVASVTAQVGNETVPLRVEVQPLNLQ